MRRLRCVALVVLAVGSIEAQDIYDVNRVRTLHLTFAQATWWSDLLANKQSETYIRADLQVDNRTYRHVGVRLRGGTSYAIPFAFNSRKLPFKIKLDAFVSGQRIYGYRSLNLNNGFWDPTFLREYLCYRMFREFTPAPKVSFVKLVINNQSWGVYINVQPTNVDFLDEWFRDSSGHRYKGQSPMVYVDNAPASYFLTQPLVSAPSTTAYLDLIGALSAVYGATQATMPTIAPQVFDMNQIARQLGVGVAIANTDGLLSHNYYIYSDPHHGRISTIPWDLNLTLNQPTWDYGSIIYFRPLRHSHFDRRVRAFARIAAERSLDLAAIVPEALRVHALLDAEVKADPKKLYPYDDFRRNLTQRVTSGLTTFYGHAQYFAQRRAFLLNKFPAGPALDRHTRTPTQPGAVDPAWVTLRAIDAKNGIEHVHLYYRNRGNYRRITMHDDGQHRDGAANDGVFGAAIPAQTAGTEIEYYIEAGNFVGLRFSPYNAGHRPHRYRVRPTLGSALLNEFLAANTNGLRDERGDRDDWLEIVNPTAAPLAVSGMYLTDDVDTPTKWRIPPGHVIPSGGALLVWADDQPGDGPLHATFKLDKGGEEIALFDADGKTLLDRVQFGRQYDDVSTGRLFDRPSPWVTFAATTPGRPNDPGACATRTYSALDPTTNRMRLTAATAPRVGRVATIDVTRAPTQVPGQLVLAAAAVHRVAPSLGVSVLVGAPVVALPFKTAPDGSYRFALPVPNAPWLVGARVYLQAFAAGPQHVDASDGLEIVFCP